MVYRFRCLLFVELDAAIKLASTIMLWRLVSRQSIGVSFDDPKDLHTKHLLVRQAPEGQDRICSRIRSLNSSMP